MIDLSGVKLVRCLDCGKCTAVCPVARYNEVLSPRRLVRRALAGRLDGDAAAVWSCLTCMQCDAVCPQEVTISRLMPGQSASMSEMAKGDVRRFTACLIWSVLVPRPTRIVPTRSSNSRVARRSTPQKYVIQG